MRFDRAAGRACWIAATWLCASPSAQPQQAPVTLTVTSRAVRTGEAEALREAVAAFNRRQSRYRVELAAANYRDQSEWLARAAASGTLPCVVEIDGPQMARFAWAGYLMPIDPFVTPALRADLLPSILQQGTYQGHLYTVGQYESGLGLWANRRYLRAAGVRIPTVAHPWSNAEFERALSRLAAVPGVQYPLSLSLYSYSASEFLAYAYLPLLAAFGGDLIDRRGSGRAQGVLDGPKSVEAMRHFQSWIERGWSRPVFDRADDFESGRTALLWSGHWKYPGLRQALGKDLVLLPLPDFGHGIKTGMGSWSLGISSTCPAPRGAWAFIDDLLSDREILRVTGLNGALPARRSALARSRLYGPGAPLEVFAQQLQAGDGVPRPATPNYGVISAAFAGAVVQIARGADVQASLTAAARTIDADIDANRGYGTP